MIGKSHEYNRSITRHSTEHGTVACCWSGWGGMTVLAPWKHPLPAFFISARGRNASQDVKLHWTQWLHTYPSWWSRLKTLDTRPCDITSMFPKIHRDRIQFLKFIITQFSQLMSSWMEWNDMKHMVRVLMVTVSTLTFYQGGSRFWRKGSWAGRLPWVAGLWRPGWWRLADGLLCHTKV